MGAAFLVRMEDLDRVTSSVEHEQRQLRDLAAVGIEWDGVVVRQSERFDLYRDAIATLDAAGLVYGCFCTRREIAAEIAAAASAPHGHAPIAADGLVIPDRAYPGTCRRLTERQRAARVAAGRRPALRLRAPAEVVVVHDEVMGTVRGVVDDVVVQRGDGVPAYNLAVVVDDAAQGVTQVVRGDDLLSSTPRQVVLQRLLGLPTPVYLHVPLVLGDDGHRLAKRHGAVTLEDLAAAGHPPADVARVLTASLGVELASGELGTGSISFDPRAIPRHPLTLDEVLAHLTS